MRTWFALFVWLLALPGISAAGAPSEPAAAALEARLDDWIAPLVRERDLAGAVLVRRGGKTVLHRAYGDRDSEFGANNRIETRFAIGSITKQFTAAALLRLRDRGRVRLEDSVASRLGVATPVAESVRLVDLLTHRSGLLRDVPEELATGSLRDLCGRILAEPLRFEPGSRTEYSNAGYVVLACVVEAVAGEPFRDHLRRSLFEPLKLSRTDFWDGVKPLDGQARGYDPAGPGCRLRRSPPDPVLRQLGAGGMVSSVGDLVRWTELLVSGAVLGPRSTREMLSDAGDGRGFGVGVYRRGGRQVIGHDGVTSGYTAFLEWYPEEELVVAYAGNIRTSAFEFLEDALPALALGGELKTVDLPATERTTHDLSLIGSYRVHEGLVLDIEPREGGLELRGSGGYFTPLLAIGKDLFWYPAMYARVGVRRDAEGRVTALQWRTVHGRDFEIPRQETARQETARQEDSHPHGS